MPPEENKSIKGSWKIGKFVGIGVYVHPTFLILTAVELVLHGAQQDFPVVENGRLVGILGNKELLQGLSQRGPNSSVAQFMRRECPVLQTSDELPAMLERLQISSCRILPVMDGNEIAGLFTAQNLAAFVAVQSALQKYHASLGAHEHSNGTAVPSVIPPPALTLICWGLLFTTAAKLIFQGAATRVPYGATMTILATTSLTPGVEVTISLARAQSFCVRT